MLVDSHCHLDFDALESDLSGVIDRAQKAGVKTLLSISTKLTTFPNVRHIAESHKNVFCTVGIHPSDTQEEGASQSATLATQLMMYAEHPKVVGIGESGLDFYRSTNPSKDIQLYSFRAHIEAARGMALPLIIHARAADDDMIQILKEETEKGPFDFILHCFASTPKLARVGIDLGGYISFSGILTYSKSTELQSLAKEIPLNRLLLETDAPFLSPEPVRSTNPCEPAFTVYTAEKLADLRGMGFKDIAEATTANFFKLFDKAKYEG